MMESARIKTCSACGGQGHNKRTCPEAKRNDQLVSIIPRNQRRSIKRPQKWNDDSSDSEIEEKRTRTSRSSSTGSSNQSRFVGVVWNDEETLWQAVVTHGDDETLSLGLFELEVDAARQFSKYIQAYGFT
jgi:hypothetical protein